MHARKPRHVGVIDEPAEQSSTLQHSSVYVVGNLLANQALLESWLLSR
ncbi:MAG: hypothetical protein HC913_01025 [Microscillaceae bacterium]|nr:hypothetical protein [Microscillaceae bacterium]